MKLHEVFKIREIPDFLSAFSLSRGSNKVLLRLGVTLKDGERFFDTPPEQRYSDISINIAEPTYSRHTPENIINFFKTLGGCNAIEVQKRMNEYLEEGLDTYTLSFEDIVFLSTVIVEKEVELQVLLGDLDELKKAIKVILVEKRDFYKGTTHETNIDNFIALQTR